MTGLIPQILVCGISTAALCRTIVYYDGPFEIFPRLRDSFLPKGRIIAQTWNITTYDELQEHFSDILMGSQQSGSELEMWRVYHTEHNSKFSRSLRGTLYSVLDCVFCLGPYVSAVMALASTFYSGPTDLINFSLNWFLVTCGSYGIHFIISKRWESA